MEYKKVKTLFNYIGGKSWLKDILRKEIDFILTNNKQINSYTEPFCGGLGAFLGVYDILLKNNIKKITLNDINKKIIYFYINVLSNHSLLIEEYMKIENTFKLLLKDELKKLNKNKDKLKIKEGLKEAAEYYLEIRSLFNIEKSNSIKSSAYLLFLQNHCFNGIYRENSKGFYNTPFNWELKYFSEEKIKEKINSVNEIFNLFEINFSMTGFEKVNFNTNTLYYLDPPYINENILENRYNKDFFTLEKQYLLIDKIKPFNFIYSNHKNKIIEEKFKDLSSNLKITEFSRKNIISSSNESRKVDKIELLISNFT